MSSPTGAHDHVAMTLEIRPARTDADLDVFAGLVRAFVGWGMETLHPGETELPAPLARVRQELEDLPGRYAAPDGSIFLAFAEGRAVGCLASFRHGPDSVELTRMWVTPEARGLRAGVALTEAVLAEARAAGYTRAVLRSHQALKAAHATYARAGFTVTDGSALFPNFYPVEIAMERPLL